MIATPSLRLLYVDDDAGLARLVQKNLERRGYAVETAQDGAGGLAPPRGGRNRCGRARSLHAGPGRA